MPEVFTPTEDQQNALNRMVVWLDTGKNPTDHSPAPFFLLMGYAGTGKSFSITELAKSGPFKPSEICFTAPTNKAVKVLRNYLDGAGLEGAPSKTIYSLLGLTMAANGEMKQIAKPEEPVDLSDYSLIVVDEASMVNKFLMEAIIDAARNWRIPFLFMGDPAQLPPVGEISSPVFAIENAVTLTKVLRYGNSMLDLATSIRNVVDSPFPKVSVVHSPPVHLVGKPVWLAEIKASLDALRSGDAKVIAWRNITVDGYNRIIRNAIFGPENTKGNPWIPTDKIVATGMLKDLQDNTMMRTDEEAVVEQVQIGQHPIHREIEIYNLLVTDERGIKRTLRVPTESGQFTLNNTLEELRQEALGGQRWKWKNFWLLKEAFHEIKHSYAITTHRSQGSSYLKTFVDREDIMLNRNRPEAFRSFYVACTRQREEIWIS